MSIRMFWIATARGRHNQPDRHGQKRADRMRAHDIAALVVKSGAAITGLISDREIVHAASRNERRSLYGEYRMQISNAIGMTFSFTSTAHTLTTHESGTLKELYARQREIGFAYCRNGRAADCEARCTPEQPRQPERPVEMPSARRARRPPRPTRPRA